MTVVIPTYNSSRTIGSTLNSVFLQTVEADIIVVDDGSKDDTPNVLLSIRETLPRPERMSIILCDHNGGGARARNIGIRAAKTDRVALIDSDDVWLPNHLEESLRTLGACAAAFTVGRLVGYEKTPAMLERECPMEYVLVRGGMAQTSSFLFLKSDGLAFDEALRKHQDFDFLMQAFSLKLKIVQNEKCTVVYRQDSSPGLVRVSEQSRPEASRRFMRKWRHLMSRDARTVFILWFHLANRKNLRASHILKYIRIALNTKTSNYIKKRLLLNIVRSLLNQYRISFFR
ncbi:MAG: glycosyltransferase family 2 protein [Mesorhizobium sp.]